MASQLNRPILQAGQLGSLVLRNRMIVTAMGVSLAEPDGTCGDRLIAYHEEQARGGAALIVTGATGVAWPNGGVQACQVALSDDRFIPGMSALARAVHSHGARLSVQLHHAGPNASEDMLAGRPLMVASVPSPEPFAPIPFLPDEFARSFMSRVGAPTFRAMTVDDIAELVGCFARAAARAREAGVDAVEIHAGHGYVLSNFLSPRSNTRTDGYGGSLENRARLLCEVIAAVRGSVGGDVPVCVKIDSREVDRPGGITIEDAIVTARLVETTGADAITVSAYHGMGHAVNHSASHTPHEPALNLPFAARIRAAVGIPVIASGRIEPDRADRAIRDGEADFIAMGRKILADPHLPRKLAQGREEAIRPCIYCYTCISAIYASDPMRCAVNPNTGHEYRAAQTAAGDGEQLHVAVVGGGTAGMEATRLLRGLGHRVTLIEREPRLGGTLRLASIAYPANERLLDWLVREVEHGGATVMTRTTATPELLRSLGADRVIVATGARYDPPPIDGGSLPHVHDGQSLRQMLSGAPAPDAGGKPGLLNRLVSRAASVTGIAANPGMVRRASALWMPIGRRVAIIGGGLVGLELAEFLADRGREVCVIEPGSHLGAGLSVVRRMRLLEELAAHGVGLHIGADAIVISSQAVAFAGAGATRISVPADTVILALGARADTALADNLRAEGFDVRACGDGNAVGFIEGAMRSAADAVAGLGDAGSDLGIKRG